MAVIYLTHSPYWVQTLCPSRQQSNQRQAVSYQLSAIRKSKSPNHTAEGGCATQFFTGRLR